MEALRVCWDCGRRKASGETCWKDRAENCASCVGSPISRGDMVCDCGYRLAGVGFAGLVVSFEISVGTGYV